MTITLFCPGTTVDGLAVEMTEKDPGSAYVTVMVSVPVFPAASAALMVMVLLPDCKRTEAVHEDVPTAFPELPVVLFVHVTPVTPTLSEAVPLRVEGEIVTVAVSAGEEILTVGFVVSGGV